MHLQNNVLLLKGRGGYEKQRECSGWLNESRNCPLGERDKDLPSSSQLPAARFLSELFPCGLTVHSVGSEVDQGERERVRESLFLWVGSICHTPGLHRYSGNFQSSPETQREIDHAKNNLGNKTHEGGKCPWRKPGETPGWGRAWVSVSSAHSFGNQSCSNWAVCLSRTN